MAELNLMNEFSSGIKEGTSAHNGVQCTFSEGVECVDDLEGSLAQGAEVGEIIYSMSEQKVRYEDEGSLCDLQQNEPFGSYENTDDMAIGAPDVGTFQVSLEQRSALQRDHDNSSSKNNEVLIKPSGSGNDLLVSDLCAVLQNVPNNAVEMSNILSVSSVLENDSVIANSQNEHPKAETEKDANVTRFENNLNLQEIYEGLQERTGPEKIIVVNKAGARVKPAENVANCENKGSDTNLPKDSCAFSLRESHIRAAKLSRFQLTVKLHDKAGTKPSTKAFKGRFACDQCSKTFKFNTGLTRHMQKCHSQSKKFQCDNCSMVFYSKTILARHILSHLGSKPARQTNHSKGFKCTQCSFTARLKRNLKKHMSLHTARKKQKCTQCSFSTNSKYTLQKHLNEAHSIHRDTLLSVQQSKRATELDLATCDIDAMQKENIPGSGLLKKTRSGGTMDTSTMERKMTEVYTIGSKLTEISKAVSFLAEKSQVISQLSEISSLASELALISSNVLLACKNTFDSSAGMEKRRSAAFAASKNLSQNVEKEDLGNDDETDDGSASIDIAATIKEELQDSTFLVPEDMGMQIQMDLKGEEIQKEDNILKPGSFQKIKDENGKKQLQCTRCLQIFNDMRSLKRHVMVHDDIRPYSCNKCGQSFRRKEHLKKHMVTHSEDRPFKCSQCSYTAKTEQRLKIHTLSHVQSKSYACTVCSYTSRTQYELNHHMKRHQTRKCTQCDYVCHSRVELKRHVSTHTTLSCPDCEFSTSDRAEYTKHTRKHSEIQLLCCEICGYSCNTMKKFKYHMLRHENKTPYQCEDCDYKCSSRASFDCHRLKHAGLKPFLCSFCGAAFRKTSHLNQHMLIHKDEKAYKCSKCGYSCRTKHNLKEHEMTHSGEKPFSCKYCNFSCRRNKALQLHMAKHESPPEVNVATVTTSLPPPYQVNLSIPLMPSLPSIQISPQMQYMQPSGMQLPLQMPLMPPGM
ncbi:hypothetical protein RRG08_027220 [Elysia crispata]|uniref:C2H2-type domain-containing protein n=1 Tax=Elysia crispata TaxID=231223 RepID=A0AAE1BAN9_9GAST|nr:hypothetical protein RRG08_027220 [Elysia crispata]